MPVSPTGPVNPLNVRDPRPPQSAILQAEYVVRQLIEPDFSGILSWRRRTSASPVLRIEDKFIVGTLDLRGMSFPYLLEFVRCRFEHVPDLRQSNPAGIEFDGCWLPGLLARNMRSSNDIVLQKSFVYQGVADFTDARIGGSLVLASTQLHNPGARTLHADRLEIAGALVAPNIDVTGEIRIPGSRIGGNVNLCGSSLHNPNGCAVDGNGLQVGGNLLLTTDQVLEKRFTATGWVCLPSAQIESDLSLRGARLSPSSDQQHNHPLDNRDYDIRTALIADRIRVNGNVDLDQDFVSTGTLRMINARIGGSLRLARSIIDISAEKKAPYENHALQFNGTEVSGDLYARKVQITGESQMMDMVVRGSIRLDGACLSNPGYDVWNARRITVGRTFSCREVDVYGAVTMQHATIGANLDLRESSFSKPGKYTRDRSIKPCIDIRSAQVERDLICSSGARPFIANGEVRISGVEIGRQTNFKGAQLGFTGTEYALNAFGMRTQELVLTVSRPPRGKVNLQHAHCASLNDNEYLWEAPLELASFRYDALSKPIELTDNPRLRNRLDWLRRSTGSAYIPGAYDQFATMLRATGNEEHADTVLIWKQRRRYSALAKTFPPEQFPSWVRKLLAIPVQAWSWLQRSMVGYGYRPTRALSWLVLLLVIGTLWFRFYPQHCTPMHGDPGGYSLYPICPDTNQDDHLIWNPFLYTLDLLIPIVDFGNKARWAPSGISQWIASSLEAAGWILATTVAAGITRALKRQ